MTPAPTRLQRFAFVAERVLPQTFLLWAFFLGCTHFLELELFTHLRTGEVILNRGAVPSVDRFVYGDPRAAWLDGHWLFQVVAAKLFALGGAKAITLAKAASLVATLALAWSAAGREVFGAWKVLLWMLPAAALSGRWSAGPELVSWLCIALFAHCLLRREQHPGRLWILPFAQVVWVNSHELFVVGPALLLFFVLDEGLRLQERRVGRSLVLVFASSLLACLANPYGIRGVLRPLDHWSEIVAAEGLLSQHPASFRSYLTHYKEVGADVFLLADAVLLAATAASFVPVVRRRRFRLSRALALVLALGLLEARVGFAPVFELLAGIVLLANLADAPPRFLEVGPRRELANCTMLLLIFLGLVSVPTHAWALAAGKARGFGLGEAPGARRLPRAACAFAGREGMPPRAFVAPLGLASVYEYECGPRRQVLADTRLGVTSPETLRRYFELLERMDIRSPEYAQSGPWAEDLRFEEDTYPVVVLGRASHPMQIRGLLFTYDWYLVYADRTAAVFLHGSQARELGLERADASQLFALE